MTGISDVVLSLIDDLPESHVSHLAHLLKNERSLDWDRLFQVLRNAAPQLDTQEKMRHFVDAWRSLPNPPTPPEMAGLFEIAAASLIHQRKKQKIELTWTGPRSPHVSLRRTDQALIELVNAARQRIIIVSFAVYKAQNIMSALEKAAERGVEIMVILESPDVSEGKIAYNTIHALGASLRQKAKIFIWPHAKRETTPQGKIGSLHAKIGVADGSILYLSSANLTDYAMNVNMEMGVLVRDKELPRRIEQHFAELITNGTLAEIAEE
jgi:phosphatidylserine/phosphatidylglycerophosphate/cardiolipin synthase-like enzyme